MALNTITFLLFYFERGQKFSIFERYIEFLFFIQFWCVFCCWMDCVECFWWYVDRFPLSFGGMSTDFLYLLVVCRQISSTKTLLKSYFYGLQLNIESYVKMNIIIFLKIWTSLNINCIWIIRWAFSLLYTHSPKGEGGILFYLCPFFLRPSKIFFVAFFSVTVDGRNLIFGHKHHIGIPYRGKRFWTHQIPTSCLPT